MQDAGGRESYAAIGRVDLCLPLPRASSLLHPELEQLFAVCHLRRAEPRAALAFFLSNLLAQHSGVVPAEAELRIRSMTTEHPQRFGALRIVVQEDVAFLAFDQGEHVDVVVHDLDSIHSGRGAGGWPTLAGLVGAGQVVSRPRH